MFDQAHNESVKNGLRSCQVTAFVGCSVEEECIYVCVCLMERGTIRRISQVWDLFQVAVWKTWKNHKFGKWNQQPITHLCLPMDGGSWIAQVNIHVKGLCFDCKEEKTSFRSI